MSSKLLDQEDNHIFVKSGPTVSLCLFGHNNGCFVQNLFHTVINNQINFSKISPNFLDIYVKFGSSHFKLNVQRNNFKISSL